MNRSEIILHNARIILRHVRGKGKDERRLLYATLRFGPLGAVLIAAASIPVSLMEAGRADQP